MSTTPDSIQRLANGFILDQFGMDRQDTDLTVKQLDKFVSVAQTFSQTLVHWDVHPGNILVNGNKSVLIDWGNACVGPAMIDLANVVEWDSPDFRGYVDAYELQSGEPFDYESTLIEYDWSRAITQIKYLPYAAKLDKGKHVERLTDIAYEYATSSR
jgi:thiamine kinase-like enzyme